MSELLGFSEEELLNTPIIEFVHPADKQKTEEEFEALNKGEGNHYFENRHITKSGKVIWLSWTTKPFYDEKITYSVAKDVTEEKELRELLDQANRLAKIGSWEVDLTVKRCIGRTLPGRSMKRNRTLSLTWNLIIIRKESPGNAYSRRLKRR